MYTASKAKDFIISKIVDEAYQRQSEKNERYVFFNFSLKNWVELLVYATFEPSEWDVDPRRQKDAEMTYLEVEKVISLGHEADRPNIYKLANEIVGIVKN